MLGIILVLIVLWFTKNLTHPKILCVSAAAAFIFAYLEALGVDAHGQQMIDTVAWRGTAYLFVNCFVSWLIFRKRIQEPVKSDDDTDETDEPPPTP